MEVPPSLFCSCLYKVSSHLVLLVKCRCHCVLCKSNLVEIASVGPRIYPQNGQRDNFTREPPGFDKSTFGFPVFMKLTLTPGFVQELVSTLHSSLRMLACELL